MASSDRIDELKRKFDENPRRYFAPLANEFRKGGDLDQAILICQEFLPTQPGHMSGHIVYGQALYESGRLDEARGVFETALSLDPENLIALRHLGDIAGRQGDPTSARRWYERVLESDPRNDEIHSLLGSLGQPSAIEAPAEPAMYSAPASAPEQEHFEPARVEVHEPDRMTPERSEEPELLDIDVRMPGGSLPTPVAPAATDDHRAASDFASVVFGDIEPTPETADLMPAPPGVTEGFEATEFAAPQSPVEQAPGLQSAFEDETGIHGAHVAPLPGLDRPETTIDEAPKMATTSAFPELDEALHEDRGEVVPPHGDPIVETAPAPEGVSHDESLLDFDMPLAEPARDAATVSEPTRADSEATVAETALPTLPAELPPEVIAAEAELIDAGATPAPPEAGSAAEESLETESVGGELSFIDVGEAAAEPTAEPTAAEHRPFVTETMAELYLKQGFRQEALAVYTQLSSSNPADERLAAKMASLRAELAAPSRSSGPLVRDFFARIAARRPGERAAAAAPPAEDDFGPSAANGTDSGGTTMASEASSAAPSAPSEPLAQGAASAGSAQPSGGSIDALFGHRPTGATEDSAASALAQAFGAAAETPTISGNPTRPASGELSLDSVFRDGSARGGRTSQGFSFDQFFSQNVEGDRTSGGGRSSGEMPAPGEAAERNEDDIEQFNSWLQGLKQR
jgi:tetratricopeptide (TPR) repeat protein